MKNAKPAQFFASYILHFAFRLRFRAACQSPGSTRPNGDPRSFPSGHASAAFATAMVLQEHYGWKVGAPVFAAAIYTGASRLTVNKHWASDVVFGAVVGMTCARTVTLHLRHARVAVRPQVVPGGGAVMFTAMR